MSPYTVSVQVFDVEDPAETVVKAEGIGNDTVATADVLVPSANPNDFTLGKIGYRGDEDWYSLTINDTSNSQVLEVFLDTNAQPSYVDYYLIVMRDSIIKKKFDANGGDGGTELKASVLVPALNSPASDPRIPVRIFSSKVSQDLILALSDVIEEGGTGVKAALPGYRVAGKTGTAQMVDPQTGKYSREKHISSFIGFAVGVEPKIVVFTSLAEPKGSYYASLTAAPLFKEVLSVVAHHYSLPFQASPNPIKLASANAERAI